ncbi:MAG TPA: bifunctional hydroxymethylpyrimidine kinase/phosphomethylpyrimidine kinase [Acidimicrobiales bacterium]|nr:bifunctional hydroxymethylpyrimidine kinase/phosphomethylpyrimidine kinase [Acidimicrobiales bacterium]
MSGETPPVALTIAGSDSGGAAGIQADLRAFAALGVLGTTAVTAVTAQNTLGVQQVHVVPPAHVDAQIASVVSDLRPSAAKTGMLATAAIIDVVAARAGRGELGNLVVDPVMVASTGARLLDHDAEKAYVDRLFPHALVITPNLREASVLVGRELRTVDDMISAARQLARTGARFVVIKGGHLPGPSAVDVIHDGADTRVLSTPRVETANVHGTGCTLSAAVAAHLASGRSPVDAVERAKVLITSALQGAAGWRIGSGQGPVDTLGWGAVASGAAALEGQTADSRTDDVRSPASFDRPG